MKIKAITLPVTLLLLAMVLSALSNTAFAQQSSSSSNCSSCHDAVEPSSTLGECSASCHSGHGGTEPETRDSKVVHRIHASAAGKVGSERKLCLSCHAASNCSSCHSAHSRQQTGTCDSCHGSLPDPGGHADFRGFLQNGKHKWIISCSTCHADDKDLLHFSTLTTEINNSNELCKICHPTDYKNMISGEHFRAEKDKKCVECHEPHLTNMPAIKVSSSNQSIFDNFQKYLEGSVITKSPWVPAAVIIIAVAAVSEHILTRHERDKIVMSNLLKITADQGSKALEIELTNEIYVNSLLEVLREKNALILGMTMHKTPEIKMVLFLDLSKASISENDLLNLIKSLKEAVVTAEYTEKYEL